MGQKFEFSLCKCNASSSEYYENNVVFMQRLNIEFYFKELKTKIEMFKAKTAIKSRDKSGRIKIAILKNQKIQGG